MLSKGNQYMNPYLGGVLLGLVLLATFYISGRGLGASGAIKSVVATSVETIAPNYAASTTFHADYIEHNPGGPFNNWLFIQLMGVLVGGFISGALAERLKFKVEHQPNISSKTRLTFALLGGALFGFGSQLGRGCTSGAALSGMAAFSLGGFITMMAIFGTAFALAYFARKLWI